MRRLVPAVVFSLVAAAACLGAGAAPMLAVGEDDLFQQAVNYIFTGRIDPLDGVEIVDRKACEVVVPEPKYKRSVKYHLRRFKMDVARINKRYSGRQVIYELEVEGDDTIVEFLKPDRKTVDYGFRTAHIDLPGDIEQTERALHVVFSEYCKTDRPKGPF
jgi:hypothetical protein